MLVTDIVANMYEWRSESKTVPYVNAVSALQVTISIVAIWLGDFDNIQGQFNQR